MNSQAFNGIKAGLKDATSYLYVNKPNKKWREKLWARWLLLTDAITWWWRYSWLRNTYYILKSIPRFLHKCWEYDKLLWRDYDFDYETIWPLIALKTRRTREYLVKEGFVHINERRMKEVEALCRRLQQDTYYEGREHWNVKVIEKVIDDDVYRLYTLMSKYSRSWWS